MSEKNIPELGSIITVVICAGMVWFLFLGGMDKTVAKNVQNINNQVANDAVQKYEISKRNGKPMDACVQASFVVAAFLQAKDESNYQRWTKTESDDCALAGAPK